MADGKRVLARIGEDITKTEPAHFTQCLVDYIDPSNQDGVCEGIVDLRDNSLHMSAHTEGKNPVKIKHPPICPIHCMTDVQKDALPKDIYSRGIDCGAVVILESGDGHILLTRRGDNLRTFPSIWVPPGGHIEQNELLSEAGLRELREETGLHITPDMCCSTPSVLAVWESVFPPKLSLGQPKRHHAVVYLYAKLKPEITSESLMSKVNIDPTEVGALAWFDRSKLTAIVAVKGDPGNTQTNTDNTETFRSIVLDADGKQTVTDLPFCDLLKTIGDGKDLKGQVSAGTKFALEEWIHLTSQS